MECLHIKVSYNLFALKREVALLNVKFIFFFFMGPLEPGKIYLTKIKWFSKLYPRKANKNQPQQNTITPQY